MIKDSKAYKYAEWCIEKDNRKVGKYVKKQAQSWIDIVNGENGEAYVDEKAFDRINSLLKLMVHPDLLCSMDEGMENYAWLLIIATLCTKLKNDKKRDIRYYTTA